MSESTRSTWVTQERHFAHVMARARLYSAMHMPAMRRRILSMPKLHNDTRVLVQETIDAYNYIYDVDDNDVDDVD